MFCFLLIILELAFIKLTINCTQLSRYLLYYINKKDIFMIVEMLKKYRRIVIVRLSDISPMKLVILKYVKRQIIEDFKACILLFL